MKKKKYVDKVYDITTVRKFRMGDDIVSVPEVKKLTNAQKNTLAIFLHKKGYEHGWIAKCLGTTAKVIKDIIYYHVRRKVNGKAKKDESCLHEDSAGQQRDISE